MSQVQRSGWVVKTNQDSCVARYCQNVYKQVIEYFQKIFQFHPLRNMYRAKRKPMNPPKLQAPASLSMLEGLLLLVGVLVVGEGVDIQAHVPGNAALSSSFGKTGLWVDD